MKKILFGITSLSIGGAERVLVDLVNELVKDYDITIFTIYDGGELKKELKSQVKLISLYHKPYKEYNAFEHLIISLKLLFSSKAPDGYDIRVAFLEGPVTRLFAKRPKNNYNKSNKQKVKNIAWVHTNISKFLSKGLKNKIKSITDKKVYKKYDKIVFVSEEARKNFNIKFGEEFDEEVIRNYLNYENIIKKSTEQSNLPLNKNDINLVSVARLVDAKAIDRFINVHAKLEKDGIHSKVYIIGDGPLRYSLQKQIDKLDETENFYLLGAKDNPYPYIKEADYFCLLSYYEGYGMVIEEAKILDKNIIVTDIPAKECVKNYDKAIIVANTENGIYQGLKKILTNDGEQNNDLNKAKKIKSDEFIKENYNEILNKVKKLLTGL